MDEQKTLDPKFITFITSIVGLTMEVGQIQELNGAIYMLCKASEDMPKDVTVAIIDGIASVLRKTSADCRYGRTVRAVPKDHFFWARVYRCRSCGDIGHVSCRNVDGTPKTKRGIMIEIKHRWNESVLFSSDKETLKEAVEEAIEKKVDLSYANLRAANLSYANLSYANLRAANLSYANLSYANLSYANLRAANLSYANLRAANLIHFKNDLFEVLLNAPAEVETLRQKLIAGEIDGSCYEPRCGMACLVGTIAIIKDCDYHNIDGIKPDGGRPAEQWFYNLSPGCKPETNAVAKITLDWIEEFQAKMARAVELLKV